MKYSSSTVWPNDADGDVFRRMQSSGFDFANATDIDFNVDFETWPPAEEFIGKLRATFPEVEVYPPDAHGDGYIKCVVHAVLTYELVMRIQSLISALALPFGGVCESWGVMQ